LPRRSSGRIRRSRCELTRSKLVSHSRVH
jgi:hypothetical protein